MDEILALQAALSAAQEELQRQLRSERASLDRQRSEARRGAENARQAAHDEARRMQRQVEQSQAEAAGLSVGEWYKTPAAALHERASSSYANGWYQEWKAEGERAKASAPRVWY